MSAVGFRFRGGRLSLDFAATLEARYREPVERLITPTDLDRWTAAAFPACAAMLGGSPPGLPGDRVVGRAHELREAIRRLVHPGTRDVPRAADITIANNWARRPGFVPVLGPDGRSVRLQSDHRVEAGLALVARDAIDLLSGPRLAWVRECERADCSVLFLDQSRPSQRRWCDMESCGNLMKARRHRHSQRTLAGSGF
jgi:predicted RNA-binding Zn ribbon-like protein